MKFLLNVIKISNMVNAQQWLDKEYPKEIRSEIKELNIDSQNLEGILNLVGFTNLERLNCGRNNLTSLDLSDCYQLEVLNCYIITNCKIAARF